MLHLRMSGLLDSLPASGLPSHDRPSVGTKLHAAWQHVCGQLAQSRHVTVKGPRVVPTAPPLSQ